MPSGYWLLLAVLVFWAVGAYNRLVRLRADVLGAFDPVEASSARLAALVEQAMPLLDRPDCGAPQSGLQGAALQLQAVLRVARRDALSAAAIATLKEAHATLQVWQGRLADAAGGDWEASPWQQQWSERMRQHADAVARFNQAGQAHDEGIAQFPALLISGLFGFRPVGRL